jgi:hypothetical protein
LYKSHVIERVQESGGVITIGAKQNVGEGGRMGYIYSSSCDFFVELGLFVINHKTAQPSSCITARHLMNEKPRKQI